MKYVAKAVLTAQFFLLTSDTSNNSIHLNVFISKNGIIIYS